VYVIFLVEEMMVSVVAPMMIAKQKESTYIAIGIATSAELGRTLETVVKSKTLINV
jgi:uncharacterized protein (UPF0254 family)